MIFKSFKKAEEQIGSYTNLLHLLQIFSAFG